MPIDKFYCVNVTAMFSKLLVKAFLIAISVNIIASVVALISWRRGQRTLPKVLTPYGEEMVTNGLDSNQTHRIHNDAIFLLYLLHETNGTVFLDVVNFATVDFSHELLQYLSDRAWPLERLEAAVKMPTMAGCPYTPSLKVIEGGLVMVPRAFKRLTHLVDVDLSFNPALFCIINLATLRQLKVLTLRSCDVRSIAPLMGLQLLIRLDVTDNKIRSIPEEIGTEMSSLAYLLIRRNRLQSLPEAMMKEAKALKFLEVEQQLVEEADEKGEYFEPHPYMRSAFVRKEEYSDILQPET